MEHPHPDTNTLAISSFSKYYNEEEIISLEKLRLSAGVHLVKGDNGSGKTTFFKCVAGILPSTGKISLNQLDLNKDPVAYRYHVNFAAAEPVFPGFLTAKDLMLFVAKTKSAPADQVTYYKHHLGIDWYFEKSCDTYSSGMLKKLSLALAFLGAPGMIILDEPLITLDEQTRSQLYNLVSEKPDTIFLLSSHQAIATAAIKIDKTFTINNKTLVIE